MVLSHSRKAYSEAVYRQTTEQFIRCMENAFCYFGGVPRTLVIDNLKAAVSKADWFDPDRAHFSATLENACGSAGGQSWRNHRERGWDAAGQLKLVSRGRAGSWPRGITCPVSGSPVRSKS